MTEAKRVPSSVMAIGPGNDSKLALVQEYHLVLQEGLWIGDVRASRNVQFLLDNNIRYVVDLLGQNTNYIPNIKGVKRLFLRVDDWVTSGNEMKSAILKANPFIKKGLGNGHGVLVHCAAGISRSATVVTSYLVTEKHMKVLDALDIIRQVRPSIQPNPGFMQVLFELSGESYSDEDLYNGKKPD